MGATVRDVDALELGAVPGLGEADVLRAIETLPGVISVSDYTAAFNVRGGSADQNLILLDGFPLYNPFHLGGLFSVFNPDMVARAELFAGGFPAEHGGRVSSVLNVESDAGPGGLAGGAGVSVLAGRVAVGADLPEGLTRGLGLGAARWRMAGRRSYLDQVARPFMEFPYHFSDLQAFVEAWTPAGGRITVTGYTGGDVLDLTRFRPDEFPYRLRWGWGNDVLGLRWSQPLGGRRALDLRVGYSRFDNRMILSDFAGTEFRSRIDHLLLRGDVDLAEWGSLALRSGVEAGRLGYDNLFAAGGAAYHGWTDTGWLGGAYAQARWMPAAHWTVELGTRGEAWFPGGGARVLALSPRLAVKRSLAGGDAAARLALGRYTQFAQSVRDEDLPIGIDVWVLAGGQAPYVVSHQAQAGLESFVGKSGFVAVEAFVRSFDGVIAFNYADDPNDPGDDFLTGTGLSYGADLLLRRESEGGTSGSVAVSWLRAWRTFPDPISGLEPPPSVRYPPIFDRRLDVELVLRRSFGGKLEAGLRWHFGTGLPYTRPLGRYVYHLYEVVNDGRLAPWPMMAGEELHHAVALGERNGARYPAYHRLDVGLRRRAGAPVQLAYLHRSPPAPGSGAAVPGARIQVRDQAGRVLEFVEGAWEQCVVDPQGLLAELRGSCYVSSPPADEGGLIIRPGQRYELWIELPGGRRLYGSTTVPGEFEIRQPVGPACVLGPATTLRVVWTGGEGTRAYMAQANLYGIAGALARRGIEVERDPLRLFWLGGSKIDTTLVFPRDFGPLSLMTVAPDVVHAIRDSLPDGVAADLVVSAVEGNDLNWVRGGRFNPSGFVRIPSVRGDGTGVFAALVPRSLRIETPGAGVADGRTFCSASGG